MQHIIGTIALQQLHDMEQLHRDFGRRRTRSREAVTGRAEPSPARRFQWFRRGWQLSPAQAADSR